MVTIMRHILKIGQWQVDDNDQYHKKHRVSPVIEYHRWSRAHLWWPPKMLLTVARGSKVQQAGIRWMPSCTVLESSKHCTLVQLYPCVAVVHTVSSTLRASMNGKSKYEWKFSANIIPCVSWCVVPGPAGVKVMWKHFLFLLALCLETSMVLTAPKSAGISGLVNWWKNDSFNSSLSDYLYSSFRTKVQRLINLFPFINLSLSLGLRASCFWDSLWHQKVEGNPSYYSWCGIQVSGSRHTGCFRAPVYSVQI